MKVFTDENKLYEAQSFPSVQALRRWTNSVVPVDKYYVELEEEIE